jgi:hypothetical protein
VGLVLEGLEMSSESNNVSFAEAEARRGSRVSVRFTRASAILAPEAYIYTRPFHHVGDPRYIFNTF